MDRSPCELISTIGLSSDDLISFYGGCTTIRSIECLVGLLTISNSSMLALASFAAVTR